MSKATRVTRPDFPPAKPELELAAPPVAAKAAAPLPVPDGGPMLGRLEKLQGGMCEGGGSIFFAQHTAEGAKLWDLFFAAAIAGGQPLDRAAITADAAVRERIKRFGSSTISL